ncbi:MAG: hypothetical protein AAFY98_00100 [Verrucomicrobiota bacterium]
MRLFVRLCVFSLCSALLYGANSSTTINDQGTILRNGEPYFPFGIYHVSWSGQRYGKDRDKDLKAIRTNGLNVFHGSVDPTSRKADYTFLDQAAEDEVAIFAELHIQSMDILIERMKDNEAIMAWTIADDFNITNSQNYSTPEQLRARHLQAKQITPNRLTYGSGGTARVDHYRSYIDYEGCVDLVGLQCYPVGNPPGFTPKNLLERCYQLYNVRAAQVLEAGMVPIANLQSFSWVKRGLFPTPSQSRNMLYGSLVAGVKGVLYYTYYDNQKINGALTLDQQAPELWQEIGRQAQEIETILPYLFGKRILIQSSKPRFHLAQWTRGDDSMLVVFSTENIMTHELDEEIPILKGYHLEPMFEDRPAGLQIHEATLQGSLAPEQVHVYRLVPSSR